MLAVKKVEPSMCLLVFVVLSPYPVVLHRCPTCPSLFIVLLKHQYPYHCYLQHISVFLCVLSVYS